ncbi:MAG: site-specific DNA-methyltransferase [Roseburia sp.]|nr:site-specific DNA-methyltransferase [Roseburia sp.]MCM1279277.1 site-specific DNA-methyltransferase [Robinsoniella sp.]
MNETKVSQQINDVVGDNVKKLEQLFPSVVKDGEVDFEALKEELGQFTEVGSEKYELTWAGKKNAKKIAQEDVVGRTLKFIPEDSKDADTTENLYIEGDNLEVLKLLRQNYYGAIRAIYIDPPYNTGNDFIYNDDFSQSKAQYELESGVLDLEENRLIKNSDATGRFHSKWCSMIYMRLRLAFDLLKDDGIIFISIDDNEVHNLKKICDEIFGADNFLNEFAWVTNITGRQISGRGAAKTWESILVYAKNPFGAYGLNIDINFAKSKMSDTYKGFNKDIREDARGKFAVGDTLYNHNRKFNEETRPNLVFSIFYNPDTEEIITGNIGEKKEGFVEIQPHANGDGVHKYHAWRWSKNKIANESYDLIVLRTSRGDYEIYTRIRDFNNTSLKDLITNISNGDSEVQALFDGKKYFDYPKSVDLLKTLLGSIQFNDGIYLDFFSGSGTSAHAIMELNAEDKGNRRFIMVQYPEEIEKTKVAYKDGYKNICEIGRERIRRAGDKIQSEHPNVCIDIGFKVLRVANTNIKWNSLANIGQLDLEQIETTPDLVDFIPNTKDVDVVYEIMLRQRNVPLSSKIEQIFGGGYCVLIFMRIATWFALIQRLQKN